MDTSWQFARCNRDDKEIQMMFNVTFDFHGLTVNATGEYAHGGNDEDGFYELKELTVDMPDGSDACDFITDKTMEKINDEVMQYVFNQ